MFVFDVSKQSEKLKNSVTDVQIKAQFSANVVVNTEAFAFVISVKISFSRATEIRCMLNIRLKKIYHNINENLETNDDFNIERKYQTAHS